MQIKITKQLTKWQEEYLLYFLCWKIKISDPQRRLFADTKLRKDRIQQIFIRYCTGDQAQVIQRVTQLPGNQVMR